MRGNYAYRSYGYGPLLRVARRLCRRDLQSNPNHKCSQWYVRADPCDDVETGRAGAISRSRDHARLQRARATFEWRTHSAGPENCWRGDMSSFSPIVLRRAAMPVAFVLTRHPVETTWPLLGVHPTHMRHWPIFGHCPMSMDRESESWAGLTADRRRWLQWWLRKRKRNRLLKRSARVLPRQ